MSTLAQRPEGIAELTGYTPAAFEENYCFDKRSVVTSVLACYRALQRIADTHCRPREVR